MKLKCFSLVIRWSTCHSALTLTFVYRLGTSYLSHEAVAKRRRNKSPETRIGSSESVGKQWQAHHEAVWKRNDLMLNDRPWIYFSHDSSTSKSLSEENGKRIKNFARMRRWEEKDKRTFGLCMSCGECERFTSLVKYTLKSKLNRNVTAKLIPFHTLKAISRLPGTPSRGT